MHVLRKESVGLNGLPGDEGWEWRAANLEEIKNLGLAGYLIGSKKDMKVSTKIDPL